MTVQFALKAAAEQIPWTEVRDEEFLPALGPVMHFHQDAEIYGEGEEAACYYKVISGVVRTCKFLADGRRQIDAFHVAGDLFGLENGCTHSLSAEAVGECEVVAYRRWTPGAKRGAPALLLEHVMRNLERAQEHAVLLGRRTAPEKVASFLLGWAKHSAKSGTIALAMTRQDMGDYLGLTLETVSRILSQMERDDLIELPSARQIRVTNLAALQEMNG
jgi:CRP/FNR family nitrogen fixation transcriptional regulator